MNGSEKAGQINCTEQVNKVLLALRPTGTKGETKCKVENIIP